MKQIPNIEETHNTREVQEIVAQLLLRTYDRCFVRGQVPPEVGSSIAHYDLFLKEELTNLLHQQLQRAREEERERIYTAVSDYRDDANISSTDFESGFNSGVDTILKYLREETIDRNINPELDQDKK